MIQELHLSVHQVAKCSGSFECYSANESLWLVRFRAMALKGTVKHVTLRLIQILNFFGTGVKSLQSCLTLCDIMDCSPRGSFVHGILQARILERKKKKKNTGMSCYVLLQGIFLTQGWNSRLMSPALAGEVFSLSMCAKSLQSCPSLCNPMDM